MRTTTPKLKGRALPMERDKACKQAASDRCMCTSSGPVTRHELSYYSVICRQAWVLHANGCSFVEIGRYHRVTPGTIKARVEKVQSWIDYRWQEFGFYCDVRDAKRRRMAGGEPEKEWLFGSLGDIR